MCVLGGGGWGAGPNLLEAAGEAHGQQGHGLNVAQHSHQLLLYCLAPRSHQPESSGGAPLDTHSDLCEAGLGRARDAFRRSSDESALQLGGPWKTVRYFEEVFERKRVTVRRALEESAMFEAVPKERAPRYFEQALGTSSIAVRRVLGESAMLSGVPLEKAHHWEARLGRERDALRRSVGESWARHTCGLYIDRAEGSGVDTELNRQLIRSCRSPVKR